MEQYDSLGKFEHSLDEKGRLIVPSKLRDLLGVNFKIVPGLDGCLFAYNEEQWARVASELNEIDENDDYEERKLVRFILHNSAQVTIDKQGRIVIPQNLKKYAKLEKDVIIAGTGRRIEFWNKDRYAEFNYDIEDADFVFKGLKRGGVKW